MNTNAPGSPEYRQILVSVLAWAMLVALNSCAMFRTEPPHRVHMPLEIPEQFETATGEEKPLQLLNTTPDILFKETSRTGHSESADETKPNDIVASLIPPTKITTPDAKAMYPGTPPSHGFSSFGPDLFFDDMDHESLKKPISLK